MSPHVPIHGMQGVLVNAKAKINALFFVVFVSFVVSGSHSTFNIQHIFNCKLTSAVPVFLALLAPSRSMNLIQYSTFNIQHEVTLNLDH
jgi:hypothetical protein